MYGRTPINELPELEDIDANPEPRNQNFIRNNLDYQDRNKNIQQNDNKEQFMPKISKFIRNPFHMNPNSGMNLQPNMHMNQPIQILPKQEYFELQQTSEQNDEIDKRPKEQQIIKSKEINKHDPLSFNCIDIARHIQECPLCSKFYNNDRTIYIIIIVLLSMICLILLKKILNV